MAEAKRRDLPALIATSFLAALLLIYLAHRDALAAITIWPFWMSSSVLVLLPLLIGIRSRWRVRLSIAAVWLVSWFLITDEPLAIARSPIGVKSHRVRVVSLNVASSLDAGRELLALHPDIILTQESMGSDEIEKLRSELGDDWTVAFGVDASILARGDLKRVGEPPYPINHTAAWLDGTLIVSLRLRPPVLRFDYWNPACWAAYADNLKAWRTELRGIVDFVLQEAAGRPFVMGGDFNTPPCQALTRLLREHAVDAFASSGRGWGATALNNYPFVRIDQIWSSPNYLVPVSGFTVKTEHSDHRIALADFD